jgi:hypothetical protein
MNRNHLPLSAAAFFAVAIVASIWAPAPDTTAAQPAPVATTIPSDSYYFPALYVNQGKETEAHIEAF